MLESCFLIGRFASENGWVKVKVKYSNEVVFLQTVNLLICETQNIEDYWYFESILYCCIFWTNLGIGYAIGIVPKHENNEEEKWKKQETMCETIGGSFFIPTFTPPAIHRDPWFLRGLDTTGSPRQNKCWFRWLCHKPITKSFNPQSTRTNWRISNLPGTDEWLFGPKCPADTRICPFVAVH